MNNLSSLPSQFGLINSLNLFNVPLQSQSSYNFSLGNYQQAMLQLQSQHLQLQLRQMENQLKIQNSQNMYLGRIQSPFGQHAGLPINMLDNYQKSLNPYLSFMDESTSGKQSPYQSEHLSSNSFSPYYQAHNSLLNEALPQYQNISFAAKTTPSNICKEEDELCRKPQPKSKTHEIQPTGQIKTQISNMIEYFVTRYNKDKPEDTARQRMFYMSNDRLLRVFDTIAQRYSSTGKCREDMSRFAMRKALTFLRDQERKASDSNVRDSSLAMCQKYFTFEPGSNDQDILNDLLPYKKNSKNKTPNCDFANQIFSSETFREDYKLYLAQFDTLMEADNKKKIKKFVEFLVNCVENNNIEKINTYKRLPWLNAWIESTKIVATELLVKNSQSGSQRPGTQEGDNKKKRGRVPR